MDEQLNETQAETPYRKTQLFAHRGIIGISCGTITINDPSAPGQMGIVVDASEVELTQAAFDALAKIERSRDSIGDVMVWSSGAKTCLGWMGGCKHILDPEMMEGDRDYEPGLLLSRVVPDSEIETPVEFSEMVDSEFEEEASV